MGVPELHPFSVTLFSEAGRCDPTELLVATHSMHSRPTACTAGGTWVKVCVTRKAGSSTTRPSREEPADEVRNYGF